MQSASLHSCAETSAVPATLLLDALNETLRAVDGRVVLLRCLPTRFDCIRDDIDLLLTESQRLQLINAARTICLQGRIHCRIQQDTAAKMQLTFWTSDCSQMLMVDLWSTFEQLPHHPRKAIPAPRLLNTLNSLTRGSDEEIVPADSRIPGLHQLPPDIDICLLIQHLARKRKSLSAPATRERIVQTVSRLASWSPNPEELSMPDDQIAALRSVAFELGNAIIITRNNVALTEGYLLRRLANAPGNRGLRILEPRPYRSVFTSLRRALMKRQPLLTVIGSDGAGKSSTVAALVRQHPTIKSQVAKKLYRRSFTYQIVSSLYRRMLGQDREQFDDRFAVLVTLRAVCALWMNVLLPQNLLSKVFAARERGDHAESLRRPLTVFDRSAASFLITNRKSDSPALAYLATWIEPIIPPVTTILMLLSHAELRRRKQEMSASGHEQYQQLLFEQALRQKPVDVILSGRTDSPEDAARVIELIVSTDTQSANEATRRSGRPNVRKAAA